MTVVLDIGCHGHPQHEGASQDSVARLRKRFRPDVLFGFDPHPALTPGCFDDGRTVLVRAAVWTHSGHVRYEAVADRPLSSRVAAHGALTVPCVDIADLVRAHAGSRLVVKLDAEGAEYPLLERLADEHLDGEVWLLLVEWHERMSGEGRRERLEARLGCRIEAWES